LFNILVSYPYYKDNLEAEIIETSKNVETRFFLDSGAFTAWKSGNPVELDNYCRFLDSIKSKPWRYLALDVIGDPHKSMVNYEIMLKRGYTPVPIFTRGEDPSVIDELYKTTDVVAIGGLVGTKKNKGFVKGIMPFFNGRNVHLLGFTNKSMIKTVKPYSCDSSVAHAASKFGNLQLFNKKNGEWVTCGRLDFSTRPSPELMELIRSYDIEPKDLAFNRNWKSCIGLGSNLNYRSHIRASIAYEKKLGVKYFIALPSQNHLKHIRAAYEKEILLW